MNDWIKVEDELPPLCKKLWVYDGEVYFDQFGNVTPTAYKEYLKSRGITHWQLMIKPNPPKEGE